MMVTNIFTYYFDNMDLINDIQLLSTSSELCYCYFQSVPVFSVSSDQFRSVPVCSHTAHFLLLGLAGLISAVAAKK